VITRDDCCESNGMKRNEERCPYGSSGGHSKKIVEDRAGVDYELRRIFFEDCMVEVGG
jgi:hypothetical protein